MQLESNKHAAILAGLRLLQHVVDGRITMPAGIEDIATNGDTHPMLTSDEVDALCEDVNCSGLSLGGAK